jgi:hypothetical protein
MYINDLELAVGNNKIIINNEKTLSVTGYRNIF